MQMNEQVLTALEVLRNFAENDFERHRIDVLERDLIAPPKVEVIDDNHQKFNGVVYRKTNTGHYIKGDSAHQAVFRYYCGDIPKGYNVHHKNLNSADNDIYNLQCLTASEHQKLHSTLGRCKKMHDAINKPREHICPKCGKTFFGSCKVKYCSDKCRRQAFNDKNYGRKYERKALVEKICPLCGKHFKCPRYRNQTYCSRACAVRARFS